MRYIIFYILCVPSFLYAQTNIPGGNISGVWTQAGSPYIISGNVEVSHTDSLIIEPGVSVIFDGAYSVFVFGNFSAEGTQSDSIFFDVIDTTGFSISSFNNLTGGWKGFLVHQSEPKFTRFDYCSLKHVKNCGNLGAYSWLINTNPEDFLGGAINVFGSMDVTITNTSISQCKSTKSFVATGDNIVHAAIGFRNCALNCGVYNSNLHHNERMNGLASFESIILVQENDIHHNKGVQGGGVFIFDIGGGTLIVNNSIHHNEALGSGTSAFLLGGGGIAGRGSPTILGNMIYNNEAVEKGGGIFLSWPHIGTRSKVLSNIVSNNTVTNYSCNDDGGGALLISNDTTALVQNNIFVNNKMDLFAGGVVNFKSSKVSFLNNIVAHNKAVGLQTVEDKGSVVANCIFDRNFQGTDTSLFNDQHFYYLSAPLKIRNCMITGSFSNYTVAYDTMSILDVDPMFVNPSAGIGVNYPAYNRDWRPLQPLFKDAGLLDPSWGLYSYDFDSVFRVQGAFIDIGPFESEGYINSVEELTTENVVNVFPNPTENQWNVKLNSTQKVYPKLFDVHGRSLNVAFEQVGDNFLIDARPLPKGIYFLYLVGGNGTTTLVKH